MVSIYVGNSELENSSLQGSIPETKHKVERDITMVKEEQVVKHREQVHSGCQMFEDEFTFGSPSKIRVRNTDPGEANE